MARRVDRTWRPVLTAGIVGLLLVLAAALLPLAPTNATRTGSEGAESAVSSASGGGAGAIANDVAARSSLAEYSWSELQTIACAIGACENEASACALAARFGLCEEGGSLPDDALKDVALVDGRIIRVQLAGIWHDKRADGGRAGLTFVFADAAGTHAMNHAFEDADGNDADAAGGWAASDMRAWLANDFWYSLPADLRNAIVPVQKLTANRVGSADELDEPGRLQGTGTDWVNATNDRVWLLSAAELCSTVPAQDDLGVDETMRAVYASEGTQYRLFADADVKAFAANGTLVRGEVTRKGTAFATAYQGSASSGIDVLGDADESSPRAIPDESADTVDSRAANAAVAAGVSDVAAEPCTWWLRTKTLEFGDGFWLVGTDGCPLNGLGEDARVVEDPSFAPDELWGPDHARGVVAGFCL